jgi:hypothetical protein
VRELVEEKESKVKEAMRVMVAMDVPCTLHASQGLTDAAFWMSWGLTYGLIFILTALLNTFITWNNVFKFTSLGSASCC